MWRSIDGGVTWSPIWAWNGYPALDFYYGYDISEAPWLQDNTSTAQFLSRVGWMVESLSIDPFDSNHWLYGTGATLYGGHDLLKWDTAHNVTIKSLADGIEETSIQNLISPPTGPSLISAVGDIGGFSHSSLTTAPSTGFVNPTWPTTIDVDYAGNKPTNIVRIGTGDSTTGKQVALSSDSGVTWNQDYGAADNVTGGSVAFSADADTVLWRTSANGVQVSQYTNAFVAVPTLPSDAQIASDKKNNSIFYGASGSSFYLSVDGGKTFAVKSSLGSSTAPAKVVVNPGVTGDVWVSTDKGLFHSTNSGSAFTAISAVTQAWAFGLGAPKTTGGYPAIFAAAIINGVTGYFRSDDTGANWVQINDAAHGFGSASSNPVIGDPRIYGRVYIGTNGRGIFYGDVSGTVVTTSTPSSTSAPPTSTTTKSSTTITSTTTKPTTTTTTKSSTTTTTKSSTTSTSTSATPTSTGTVAGYGQCGGSNYTGPTVCVSGFKCVYSNDFYSQCVPA
jgi:xyloglucan-specific exo-beta-1,4-glucanase